MNENASKKETPFSPWTLAYKFDALMLRTLIIWNNSIKNLAPFVQESFHMIMLLGMSHQFVPLQLA